MTSKKTKQNPQKNLKIGRLSVSLKTGLPYSKYSMPESNWLSSVSWTWKLLLHIPLDFLLMHL